MTTIDKPFVQLAIEEVDTVIYDPELRYDSEHYDRYPTYESARDAALTSIEVMLDEADYDGEDHQAELERMRSLLESSGAFPELEGQPGYHWFLERLELSHAVAA